MPRVWDTIYPTWPRDNAADLITVACVDLEINHVGRRISAWDRARCQPTLTLTAGSTACREGQVPQACPRARRCGISNRQLEQGATNRRGLKPRGMSKAAWNDYRPWAPRTSHADRYKARSNGSLGESVAQPAHSRLLELALCHGCSISTKAEHRPGWPREGVCRQMGGGLVARGDRVTRERVGALRGVCRCAWKTHLSVKGWRGPTTSSRLWHRQPRSRSLRHSRDSLGSECPAHTATRTESESETERAGSGSGLYQVVPGRKSITLHPSRRPA